LDDISSSALNDFFDNGTLRLAVDVNENASGNESKDAIGIAIKSLELTITTTAGTFTSSDIYTSTQASIVEDGASSAADFYTLFGQTGRNSLTSSTANFDLSSYDDVLEIRNVSFTGDVQSATISVNFLKVDTGVGGANEDFFDFSGGFENFAILSAADSNALEEAAIGESAASSDITYAQTSSSSSPGGPAPPLPALGLLAGLLAWRGRRRVAKA
jgi:MYXO-CTERM domain-containing protein